MKVNTHILKLWVVLCILFAALQSSNPALAQDGSPLAQQNNRRALALMNRLEMREARYLLGQALSNNENPSSYYLLGHLKLMTNEWDSACIFFEKALQLAPDKGLVYQELFQAYKYAGRWEQAKAIQDKVKYYDPGGDTERFTELDKLLARARLSVTIVVTVLLLAAALFFFRLFKKQHDNSAISDSISAAELFLTGAFAICILYTIFYAIAPWVVRQNEYHPPLAYTRAIRWYSFEHDGTESFVMYILMFAGIVLTLVFARLLVRLRSSRVLYIAACVSLFLVAGYYFMGIGVYPPDISIDPGPAYLPVLPAVLALGLYLLYCRSRVASVALIMLVCAFCGLITIATPSCADLMYICAPALRLYHGFKPSEIYFQYDLFLSFLAYAWMKINLDISSFPYLGTVSFFLFFIGSFFFMDKYMKTKGLSVIFIVALILARLYIQGYDNPVIFQVSPLRLDLWLILLLLARHKGVHHWSVGLAVGLLVLFHRNLGLIYMAAYLELLAALLLTDILGLVSQKDLSGKNLGIVITKHFRQSAISLGLVILSVLLCFILFHELFSPSALTYRRIGVGMLPVSRISFYWYAPVVVSMLVGLLYFYRARLGERYMSVGLFIALITIGNSMYFFGRSHENNVLNIAGVLVFALFTLLDILVFLAPQPVGRPFLSRRSLAFALPVIFILLTSYTYFGKTHGKIIKQYNNLEQGRFILPCAFEYMDTAAVRQVTHNDSNVFILDNSFDFYFYYYGHYKPVGLYNPMSAWIYKKDFLNFVQGLLDKNYHVVYNAKNTDLAEYIEGLTYNSTSQVRDMASLRLVGAPMLLPHTQASAYHVVLKDTLAAAGMSHSLPGFGGDFTMEYIVRPNAAQVSGACIADNLFHGQFDGMHGFTLRSDGMPGRYIFAFGNETEVTTNISFPLDTNKWNYVCIIVNGTAAAVFVNGDLVGRLNTGGISPFCSYQPVTIGNSSSKEGRFSGDIREVSITHGFIDTAAVAQRWHKVQTELNNGASAAQ